MALEEKNLGHFFLQLVSTGVDLHTRCSDVRQKCMFKILTSVRCTVIYCLRLLIFTHYVLGCRAIYSWVSSALNSVGQQAQFQSDSALEEQVDPFSLVAR